MAEGRRARMRERVEQFGICSLAEHEIVEFLLYPYIPRRDVNPLAHRLISDFGSLKGVLQAKPSELFQYEGMTRTAALYLPASFEVVSMVAKQHLISRDNRNTPARILEHLELTAGFASTEMFIAIALDARGKIIRSKEVTCDDGIAVHVNVRDLVAFALLAHAHRVVVGHNHPDGDPYPSDEDIEATLAIMRALDGVQILFADHLIVAGGQYFSFRQHGLDVMSILEQTTAAAIRQNSDVGLLK